MNSQLDRKPRAAQCGEVRRGAVAVSSPGSAGERGSGCGWLAWAIALSMPSIT
ncbi:MAG: hypothetical protein QOH52_1472 [Pseudonocardiales bacterium]|nr:hypothetical protein [Pseudonocardiales bacterium]